MLNYMSGIILQCDYSSISETSVYWWNGQLQSEQDYGSQSELPTDITKKGVKVQCGRALACSYKQKYFMDVFWGYVYPQIIKY